MPAVKCSCHLVFSAILGSIFTRGYFATWHFKLSGALIFSNTDYRTVDYMPPLQGLMRFLLVYGTQGCTLGLCISPRWGF